VGATAGKSGHSALRVPDRLAAFALTLERSLFLLLLHSKKHIFRLSAKQPHLEVVSPLTFVIYHERHLQLLPNLGRATDANQDAAA
jgi:hypothetical protein